MKHQLLTCIAAFSAFFYACGDDVHAVQVSDSLSETDCISGSQTCSGNVLLTCIGGVWKQGLLCEYGCSQDGSGCITIAEAENTPDKEIICELNAVRCADSYLQSCDGFAWLNGDKCEYGCNAEGYACLNENDISPEQPVCTLGIVRCIDGFMHACTIRGWSDVGACDYGCRDDYACSDCVEGNKHCVGSDSRLCQNGSWVPIEPCISDN